MLVGKNLIKKLVGSLATVLAFAVPSLAADVRPLQFQGISMDHDVQQAYWDSLMMYKMFGTNGIVFAEGGNIKITDKTGRFGTAKGDFVLTKNGGNDYEVGGPILIGGDIRMGGGTGNVEFSTGPTRVTGTVIINGDNLNGGAGTNHFRGYNCIGAQPSPAYDSYAENKFFGDNYNSCPDSVPHVMSDLSIPTLIKPAGAKEVASINRTDGAIYDLDIPEGKEMYDLYIPSIVLNNGASMNVRMPKGGRLTRIFLKSMAISQHTTIHVQYKNDQGDYDTVADTAYAGNLLFYVESSIKLEARTNGESLHGTFISTDTIQVAQQTTLSGQFLAKNLIISANFDGSGFHYVPFDPKYFDPEAGSFGTIYEGTAFVDSLQPLTVRLNEAPKNPVTFDYCFIVDGPADAGLAENNFEASLADIDQTDFPLCSKNQKKSARFSPNRDTLDSRITVKVANDGILENLERFKIKIFNLEGAVYSEDDAGREGEFFIYIEDDDRTPVCRDTTLVGLEDEIIQFTKGKINEFPAFANDSVTPLDSFGVAILTAPVNSFTVFNIPVDLARPISSSDHMGEVRYIPGLNEYGESGKHYDSLTFAIEVNKGVRSEPCKMYFDIKPVNDKPVLNDTTITIRENTPVDSVILQLIASDVENDKLIYSIDSGATTLFGLTGTVKDSLYVKAKLDFETAQQHVLKVVVTEDRTDGQTALKDTAYVTIKVTDENEDPKFDEDEYKFIVREHAPYDSFFGIIHATDPDSISDDASYNKVRYSYKLVSPVKEDSAFWLSDIAGTFAVKNSDSLNYEKIDEYVLWAYATDAKGLYDSVKVTITVDDINEDPEFEKDKFYYQTNFVSIPEKTTNGSILTFNFSDPDVKSILEKTGYHELQLTLLPCTMTSCDLGNENLIDSDSVLKSLFTVTMNADKISGELNLVGASKLDYEKDSTYNMVVELRDNAKGIPSLVDTIVIHVRITNVNEEPKFDSTKYTFSVKEHQLDRIKVGEIHATDVDHNTTLTYFLGDSTTFSVNQKTGAIYTKKSLDYEVDSLYKVMAYVTDNDSENPLMDSVPVTIKVIDINETPWAGSIDCVVPENSAAGTALELFGDDVSGKCIVVGQDPDKYNKNFNQLTYTWADSNEAGVDLFTINATTGAVTVTKSNSLDYETTKSYKLTVKVADNGNPSLDSTAMVNIRIDNVNEPPVLADTVITISEKTNGNSTVLKWKAVDPEVGAGRSGLTYSILSQNFVNRDGLEITAADFKMNTTNAEGVLKVVNPPTLDYDTKPKYILKVLVVDVGGLRDTATVTVIITDVNEPPYFDDDEFSFFINEHNPENALVDSLIAWDDDYEEKYNQLHFSLLKDTSGLFAVSENGYITVPEKNILNYESVDEKDVPPIYDITVVVSDGFLYDTAVVHIEIGDINESPILKNKTCEVKEHKKSGEPVCTVVATDPDYGDNDNLAYKLVGSSAEFAVDMFGNITTKKELNYEEPKNSYTIKVQVSDDGTPNDSVLTATATITIKVVDVNETPSVGNQYFTISELATKDTLVGTVVGASDKDSLNPYFSDLKYEISDTIVGGVETKGADYFTINKVSGKISVKDGATFDYETKGKVYYLKLTVTDHADPDKDDKPLSATALITINIEDVDEPPEFPQDEYEFDVDENSPEGVLVGKVAAGDKDEGETLTYELKTLDGKVSDQFQIFYADNKAEIKVKAGANLDYETLAHYEVMVIVTDKSNLKDTAKVVITVNDVNETPTLEEQYFELDENSGADFKLDGIVEAGDLDTASVFTKHYFTAIGGDTDLFTMNSRGEIFANYDMDYEEYKKMGKTTFVLNTKVTDRLTDVNGDSLFVIKNMYIYLKNVNEDPYVTTDTLEVKENSKTPTLVGMLDAEDPDGPTTFSFSIARASDEFYVETDGSVRVNVGAILDYETKNEYKIYVNVTDKEGATSKEKPVIIKILDVNEAPVLNDTILYVSEDATVDTIFGKVVGSDPDKYNDAFNQLSYGMVSPKDTFDFLTDGSAKLLRRLDYEAITSYVRQVYVTDGFEYDTANVIIKVVNVVESTHVEIIQVDDPDSIWVKPDTIYTNVPDKNIEWIEDDKKYKSDTTLVEGPNVISRCFWDRTKDYEGCDTVIIYYSSSKPIVTVYAEPAKVTAENVYTIVEEKDKSDTTVYVNTFEKEITVSIVDTASGVNSKFTVALELDSVESVSKKTMKDINNIAGEKITIRDGSDVETTKLKITGTDQVVVSYMDTVTINGEKFPVKVSYNTNNKGEETMTEVVNEKGKVEKMQVITVSYTTKGDDGKDVTISYYADAITGEVLNTTSGGQLTKADPGSTSGMAQNAVGTYTVSYDYKDKGNSVNVHYVIDDEGHFVKNEDGDIGYEVSYTYVNKFGNVATKSVFIVVDQVGPKVKILEPDDEGKIKVVSTSFIDVKWTVNGIEQDTLTSQGLEKGLNAVVRFYRDKAGNETSDTVFIMMKNSKTIDIHPEQPVTLVNREKVEEYYADNPPKEGQTYAVSIMNPTSGDEKETLIGGKGKPKEGSGETPYENVDSPYHLGPTLALDIKLPVVRQTDENAKMDGMNTGIVSGLATLDDLVNADGRIPLDGVDANDGEKPTVEEFVEKYCVDGFKVGSDLSKVALYDSKIDIKIWVYTTLGGFVNYYHFAQELNDPDYVNPAGMTKLFFEMKPDKNGDVRTDDGRLLATGSYVYKVEVKLRSELLCSLPPVEDGGSPKKGDVIKNNDQLLTSFGYKRPKE